jgi:hypothetical protein
MIYLFKGGNEVLACLTREWVEEKLMIDEDKRAALTCAVGFQGAKYLCICAYASVFYVCARRESVLITTGTNDACMLSMIYVCTNMRCMISTRVHTPRNTTAEAQRRQTH